jgi:hypothetical protein
MNRLAVGALSALASASLALAGRAGAEPYLAVWEGSKCVSCHVNPTGGGLRNGFGTSYTKSFLPMEKLDGALDAWNGQILDLLRIGGDLREDWSRSTVPGSGSQSQVALQQVRVYADVALIRDRLAVYVDEQVAPGASQNLEAYVRLGNSNDGLYLKGGQFYLPFGWRLQDQTAYVREVSAISMTTPQQGVEVGYEHRAWSAQVDYTTIPAAGAGTHIGHQTTGQVAYVQPQWRLGVATSLIQSDIGNRQTAGLLAGLRTGPVSWLGEIDLVHDASFPGGRRLGAGLLEADWRIRRGHFLKISVEGYDPDRSVANDQQARYSFVYEFTPIPFLQLRAGYRRYRGIPQSPAENQRLTFLELHAFY